MSAPRATDFAFAPHGAGGEHGPCNKSLWSERRERAVSPTQTTVLVSQWHVSSLVFPPPSLQLIGPCVVRDANMGHQLAGGNSSWCPELEVWTTHRLDSRRGDHALGVRSTCGGGQ